MANNQQLFDGKYTLDQALVLTKESLGNNFNKIDLLKALSTDNTFEFHCYVIDLPLLIELSETTYEEGKGTIGKTIGYEISCYTGFFNLSLSDCGSGAKYISNLAHDIDNVGVVSLEGLHWEEIGSLVVDLEKTEGFDINFHDCEGANWFSNNFESFEYVPTKPYRPTIEQLYVEKIRFNLWLENEIFTEATDGTSKYDFYRQVMDRGNPMKWIDDFEINTEDKIKLVESWAKGWKDISNDHSSVDKNIKKAKELIEACNPSNKVNKKLINGNIVLEALYKKSYPQLLQEFAYLNKINQQQFQTSQISTNLIVKKVVEPDWEVARNPATPRKDFLIDAMIEFWRNDFNRLPTHYDELKRWILNNKNQMAGYQIETQESDRDLSVVSVGNSDAGFKRTYTNLIIKLN